LCDIHCRIFLLLFLPLQLRLRLGLRKFRVRPGRLAIDLASGPSARSRYVCTTSEFGLVVFVRAALPGSAWLSRCRTLARRLFGLLDIRILDRVAVDLLVCRRAVRLCASYTLGLAGDGDRCE